MKVTVVVLDFDPCANADRCIDSILRQTHRDIEILLMTDRSIIRQDDRTVRISFCTGGMADIDIAVKQATGEYICFVDTGSCLSPVFVQTMSKMCTESMADMAACGFMPVDRYTPLDRIGVPLRLYHPEACDRKAFLSMLAKDEDNILNFFENKLYRTELMQKNLPLTGDDKLDNGIVWHVAHSCETITVTGEPLFFYTEI